VACEAGVRRFNEDDTPGSLVLTGAAKKGILRRRGT